MREISPTLSARSPPTLPLNELMLDDPDSHARVAV
jgi:hypothetical protein